MASTIHHDKWLSVLDQHGIPPPRAYHYLPLARGSVQTTEGELPGVVRLPEFGAHALVVSMTNLQHMRQKREGSIFESDMLRGEMSLMPRGTPSEWSWKHECDRLDVMVGPDILGDGKDLEVVSRFRFRDPEMEPICRRLFEEVGRNGESEQQVERLYVESLVTQLAVLLMRRHSTLSSGVPAVPGGLTRTQMRRVLDYIESNLNADLSLGDLAGVTDLSLHHFAHMFKQTMGAAPHRYVLERRVERAKELLRCGRSSLVDISLSLGFCSQSHFTNTFRRMVGATPSEFRMGS
jgi:AraC family transcriptional regulator